RRPRVVGQHASHERPALARRAALVRGDPRGVGCGARRFLRGDVARGRRRASPPLPHAERSGVGAAADLRARRSALTQRTAPRRIGARRGPRPRPCGRALAPVARARGGRWLVDPDRSRRADGRMRQSIVSDVKARGNDAVREWALRLDGVEPARAVPEANGLPRTALLELADRVRRWHAVQRPADVSLEVEPGVRLERRWVPLDTVGIYAPRRLLSTLVMCAVPAQVAGVRRIVVCTPPEGAPMIAAAAEALGLDEVWALGGPEAVRWLRYVERVDKSVGPGSSYVNDAKLEVARDVAIDLPGGPSEVVVAGDGDERLVELELAAQQEHGPKSVCRTVASVDEAERI